jgi:hypothetical protein
MGLERGGLLMRAGLIVSALGHGIILLVAFIVLANPRLMDAAPTPALTVDLVPANEIGQAKGPEIDPSPDKPLDAPATGEAKADPPPAKAAEPRNREAASEPVKSAARQKPADAPANRTAAAASQVASPQAASPQAASPQVASPQAASSPPARPKPERDPFAPDAVPVPLYLPNLPMPMPGLDGSDTGARYEFDAPAAASAKLTREEVEAFRAHLQKCWKVTASVAAAGELRVALRVLLKPNGALVRDPELFEASPSVNGPMLVAAATRALQQCQPFTFLPAEKYREWKELDLTFSPSGLAGG